METFNPLSRCINNALLKGINVSKHARTLSYVLIVPPQMTSSPHRLTCLQQLTAPPPPLPPPASCLHSPCLTELCAPREFAAVPRCCVQSQLFVIWRRSKCSKHGGTPPSVSQTGTSARSAARIIRLCASFREVRRHLLTWTNAANQRLPERHGEGGGGGVWQLRQQHAQAGTRLPHDGLSSYSVSMDKADLALSPGEWAD